jgi:acyl-CoA thioester hydrolase
MTPAPFRYYLRVRYQECDAQGVVFNARYGDYVDVAAMEFFRAIGFADTIKSGAFDVQLVKQTTTWKAPARNNDVIEVTVAATRLGTTSLVLTSWLRIAGAELVTCAVETIYVCVDGHSLNKRPLRHDERAALIRGAPGIAIDHAGYLTL